jgi:hypothetical protein
MSKYQQTYEYSINGSAKNVWCDTTTYLSFANYILNPSPLSNILNLVELDVLNDDLTGTAKNKYNVSSILLHPDWILAAWSANATIDGVLSRVDGTRSSAILLIQALKRFLNVGDPEVDGFVLPHIYTVLQAASLAPYSTVNNSAATPVRASSNSPALKSLASVQLWKFGLDSRTSRLGLAVLLVGCIIVLWRTAIYHEATKSPTAMIVLALQHPPPPAPIHAETGAPLRIGYEKPPLKRASSSFSFWHPQSPPISPISPNAGRWSQQEG